jgi:hypothetical protein
MEPIRIVRIFSDADGESHFEDISLPTEIGTFGGAKSLSAIAEAIPASSMTIREVREEGPLEGVWHPTPARMLKIFPLGLCEIEASDGEIRQFGPDAHLILLGEDNTGRGHLFRPISGPRMTIFIDVSPDWNPTA